MVIEKKLAEEIVATLKHCLSGQGTGDFDLGQLGGNRLPTGRKASDVLCDLETALFVVTEGRVEEVSAS
jgi:hypothetical protein